MAPSTFFPYMSIYPTTDGFSRFWTVNFLIFTLRSRSQVFNPLRWITVLNGHVTLVNRQADMKTGAMPLSIMEDVHMALIMSRTCRRMHSVSFSTTTYSLILMRADKQLLLELPHDDYQHVPRAPTRVSLPTCPTHGSTRTSMQQALRGEAGSF